MSWLDSTIADELFLVTFSLFILTAYSSFALERGDWDATWYCIDCYIARAAKKALYAHGEK